NAAPGLPNNATDASKGRTPMVDTATTAATVSITDLATHITDNELTFTPAELNTLISRACAQAVAARMRQRAAGHRREAQGATGTGDELTRALAAFLTIEADMLEAAADRELAALAAGGEQR